DSARMDGVERAVREFRRDEGAGAAFRLEVAFREQLVVGGADGDARHAVCGSEGARRRHAFARAKTTVKDASPPRVIESTMTRRTRAEMEHERDAHKVDLRTIRELVL